jgi:FAD/FMN-containing dehydrogenase
VRVACCVLRITHHVLEIDHENLMVTVEPGVITGDIHRAVEAEGLFYPPDPASLDSCSIGGNIAEGAGGPRAVKYGVTKDYVCGLEAVRIICFGHAGDGNVHVNVLKDELPDDRWESLVPAVAEGIYRLALSLGGMITGEHGVGATRRRYLPLALDAVQIDVMRQIRAVFDPNGILNPGKIFP